MPPNQPKKVPTNHFKIWSEIFEIHRTGVRSYRIRPHSGEWVVFRRQWMMKQQFFDDVFWWYPFEFERTSVGAYRIRPHGGEWGVFRRWMNDDTENFRRCILVIFIWIWANKCRGVSHTPLRGRMRHRSPLNGFLFRRTWAYSPLWRAYAIRPYTFSLKIIG